MKHSQKTEEDSYIEPVKPNPRLGKTIRSYCPVFDGKGKVLRFKWEIKNTNKTLRRNITGIETDLYNLKYCEPYEQESIIGNYYPCIEKPVGRIKVPSYIIKHKKWEYCVFCDSHTCNSFDLETTRKNKGSLKKVKFSSKPSRHYEKKLAKEGIREYHDGQMNDEEQKDGD